MGSQPCSHWSTISLWLPCSVFFGAAPPLQNESKGKYLLRVCGELSKAIYKNREVIDGKVDQLLLGQASIRNAVWGLLIVLSLVLAITIDKTHYYGAGAILVGVVLLVLIGAMLTKAFSS